MSLKQVKQFLKERNLECEGCAEKRDFIDLALENINTPMATTASSKDSQDDANAPISSEEAKDKTSEKSQHEQQQSDDNEKNENQPKKEFKLEDIPQDKEAQLDMLMEILDSAGKGSIYSREELRKMLDEIPEDSEMPEGGLDDYQDELDKMLVEEEDLAEEENEPALEEDDEHEENEKEDVKVSGDGEQEENVHVDKDEL